MAKIKKKGTSGQAKNFITRTQAVRKLQISLPDFRKLCIWKGIYPREPRSKKKASRSSNAATTFYYTKDIQYLAHEPLLQKFREQKTLEKKIARALGRGNALHASQLERNANRPEKTGKTSYTLDHVIRDRYPTFIDALRDLDDCLSLLFLFANLPSTPTVPAKMIARCEKLCLEFQHYLIMSNNLRKSFLSIKGIYYQATIQGQDILWLVPYRFNQRITNDVDFRILGTFVEFYQTLLGFVNFRLYTSIGLVYPPKFDIGKDNEGAELDAFMLEANSAGLIEKSEPIPKDKKPDPKLQAEIDKLMAQLHEPTQMQENNDKITEEKSQPDQATDLIDKFEQEAPGGDILPQPSCPVTNTSSLFSNFTFFLSRETPRQPLEFLLRAFGCKRIGWDAVLGQGAFTNDEQNPLITHQVVDRPPIVIDIEVTAAAETTETSHNLGANRRVPGRIYIQPQWVWDSINDEELKRPDLYAPGAELPPHLSPFITRVQGQYDPRAPLEEQERENEELEISSDDEEISCGDKNEDFMSSEGNIDTYSEEKDDINSADAEAQEVKIGSDDNSSFSGFSDADEEDDATNMALQRQKELESELTGVKLPSNSVDPNMKAKINARRLAAKREKEEEEEIERAKMMMSRKKRKIMGKMVYSNKKKLAEAELLRSKRRKLEKSGKSTIRA
ncbi:Pescadillo-like protein [Golovinomyces cichoracearum]|uniref:Pescadillo homolog n=1 Tax=Golovinomyces cichoracearum TaxID=62708 RepID=A0A420ID10_9PEZI|nr:Pescadillo-like protein [Golovinomyces cichoracearum]